MPEVPVNERESMLNAARVKKDSHHLFTVIVAEDFGEHGTIGRVVTGKGAGRIYKSMKPAVRTDVRTHHRTRIIDGPNIGKGRARVIDLSEMSGPKQKTVRLA